MINNYLLVMKLLSNTFFKMATIRHISDKPKHVKSNEVKLRGIHIQSHIPDLPNLIFFPQVFDRVQNWLQFFTKFDNNILQFRNVWILYPRNFGNSDRNPDMHGDELANDTMRFMYENKISMATMAGHGLGAKVALLTAMRHYDKSTGYFGIATVPTNQYYFQAAHELRSYLEKIDHIKLWKPFHHIKEELKQAVIDPKWREVFEGCLEKGEHSYNWNFDMTTVKRNLTRNEASSLWNWTTSKGLYTGRACFVFPEYSRFVHLSTNTNAMLNKFPQLGSWNHHMFYVQGDNNPRNHWVYDTDDIVNPFAIRLRNFLSQHDGVHVLLSNRSEVGEVGIPDRYRQRVPRDPWPDERIPAHYYHNWRFNNVYEKKEK